jgi:poly(3-hydroxybutyrate) depolymerase
MHGFFVATLLTGMSARCACAQTIARTAVFQEATGPVQRAWLEYRPMGVSSDARLPTVVVMHPGASSPANIQIASRWDAVADAHGLMIVYPSATPGATTGTGVWNAWDWASAPVPNGTPQGIAMRDDVGFLRQLVDLVCARAESPGDRARVYMTGFSSGAQMASTYAGSGATNVAAFAPVSGGWCEPYGVPDTFCVPARATPLWLWRGARENSLMPAGVSRLVHDEQQRDYWVAFNGAGTMPTTTQTVSVTDARVVGGVPSTVTVTHTTSAYLHGAAPVLYTEVAEGSHEYQVGAARRLWEEFFSTIAQCDSIDFNGDGVFPDNQDLIDFVFVFAGGTCPTGTCGDVDFNNDGVFPDNQDVVTLVQALGGGECGE